MGVSRPIRGTPIFFIHMQGSKILKMLNLPLEARTKLLKELMASNPKAWKHFYKNYADDGIVEGKSMNQFHYLMSLDECEKVDGTRGNADFNKYIYKKSYEQARLA